MGAQPQLKFPLYKAHLVKATGDTANGDTAGLPQLPTAFTESVLTRRTSLKNIKIAPLRFLSGR